MPSSKHPFRKRWGQNFLQDKNVIAKIVALLDIQPDDTVLEIGPGQGALTFEIAKIAKHVIAVEIDPLLVDFLNQSKTYNMEIIQSDILNMDLDNLPNSMKIIGNLPYNITSPILFKFLDWGKWEKMVFMTQKEVAERIVSASGNKKYGRLSVMSQILSNVSLDFHVSNTVFHPKPDVQSSVLSFQPSAKIIKNIDDLSKIVKLAFSQRRKKIKNNLRPLFNEEELVGLSDKRAEDLKVSDYLELYKQKYL
jgi:16S rRNA (adenine1518-N6/adenine1519-N6)-dimethyltransferase